MADFVQNLAWKNNCSSCAVVHCSHQPPSSRLLRWPVFRRMGAELSPSGTIKLPGARVGEGRRGNFVIEMKEIPVTKALSRWSEGGCKGGMCARALLHTKEKVLYTVPPPTHPPQLCLCLSRSLSHPHRSTTEGVLRRAPGSRKL